MSRLRPRFSLKILLIAVTVVPAATYWFMLPTVRAMRFAACVRSGENAKANAMLPDTIEPMSPYRQVLRQASMATLQPLTLSQLLRGERRVIAGKGWGGGDAEFIISQSTVTLGTNWFNYL